MKATDKLKKEKSTLLKPHTAVPHKKADSKKQSAKKDDLVIPKRLSFGNVHNKTSTGFTSPTQSSKQFNPSAASCKNSPKASLGQTKVLHLVIINQKNFQLAEKNKEEIKKSLANVIKVYYPQKKSCLDNSFTQITKDTTQKEEIKLTRNDFHFIQIIGQGRYGKVWKVELAKTKKLYAMKEMSKALIVMKKSVDNVLNEKKIIQGLSSPFIANMSFAFNDRDNPYLVMDLLPGADLRQFYIGLNIARKYFIETSSLKIQCLMNRATSEQLILEQQEPKIANNLLMRVEPLVIWLQKYYAKNSTLMKQISMLQALQPISSCQPSQNINHSAPLRRQQQNRNQRGHPLQTTHDQKTRYTSWLECISCRFRQQVDYRCSVVRLGSKRGIKQIKSHVWLSGFDWGELQSKRMKSPFRQKQCFYEVSECEQQFWQAVMQYKLLQGVQTSCRVCRQRWMRLRSTSTK